jgi:hypothetical protein
VKAGIADRRTVIRDVRDKVDQMQADLDPRATPTAETFSDEVRRNFDIGMNQGELAFDVGSFVVGGPLAKSMKELGLLSKSATYEKAIAQGFSPEAAAYLSEPYPARAMGHHFIPRRARIPSMWGGRPLPRAYSDGPFNRLAPEGITRGEFYERHFRVDPQFYGAGLAKRLRGESWSGNKLGLDRYSLPERLWYASPAPLKARVGGLTAGAGDLLYSEPNQEEW